jgi:hypothetical protein
MASPLQIRRFVGVVAGLLAVLFVIKVWHRHTFVEFRPECPLNTVRIQDSATHEVRPRPQLATVGTHTLVPEFNDCQRFVDKGEAEYGPLVGIFANEHLNDQIDRMYQLAKNGARVNAVSIALILDFGEYSYKDLGILRTGDGFNCLYMAAVIHGAETTLTAYVQWIATDTDCAQDQMPEQLRATGKELKVYPRTPRVDYAGDDYPQVARWDWDPARKLQYIGIGCKYAWCEIGNPPMTESPSYVADPASPRTTRRVREVKGWYDEEVLAVDNGSGTLVPSHTIGTLIAEPGLDTLLVKHFGTWQRVAKAVLQGPPLNYTDKLNFEDGSLKREETNVIELCKGDANDCGVTPPIDTKACVNQPDDPWTNNNWWARITSAQHHWVKYRCVLRREHANLRIPGMVRWRWNIKDQVGWIKCDAGCCEVTGLH